MTWQDVLQESENRGYTDQPGDTGARKPIDVIQSTETWPITTADIAAYFSEGLLIHSNFDLDTQRLLFMKGKDFPEWWRYLATGGDIKGKMNDFG